MDTADSFCNDTTLQGRRGRWASASATPGCRGWWARSGLQESQGRQVCAGDATCYKSVWSFLIATPCLTNCGLHLSI